MLEILKCDGYQVYGIPVSCTTQECHTFLCNLLYLLSNVLDDTACVRYFIKNQINKTAFKEMS